MIRTYLFHELMERLTSDAWGVTRYGAHFVFIPACYL